MGLHRYGTVVGQGSRVSGVDCIKSSLVSWRSAATIFFFSSRRRHTRCLSDWSQTCALPILEDELNFRHAVELVFRNVLGRPIAAVVGKIEFLRHRMPVEADRVAYALRNDFRAAAVEIDAADRKSVV